MDAWATHRATSWPSAIPVVALPFVALSHRQNAPADRFEASELASAEAVTDDDRQLDRCGGLT